MSLLTLHIAMYVQLPVQCWRKSQKCVSRNCTWIFPITKQQLKICMTYELWLTDKFDLLAVVLAEAFPRNCSKGKKRHRTTISEPPDPLFFCFCKLSSLRYCDLKFDHFFVTSATTIITQYCGYKPVNIGRNVKVLSYVYYYSICCYMTS